MVQTRYRRPFSLPLHFAILAVLFVVFVVLLVKLGGRHPATITIMSLILAIAILGRIFDPDTAYLTETTLDDGTVVPVKRPLIGFKHLEVKLGVTGDYEVRSDGWRHEPALLRI
jgi:hypothetical protein